MTHKNSKLKSLKKTIQTYNKSFALRSEVQLKVGHCTKMVTLNAEFKKKAYK